MRKKITGFEILSEVLRCWDINHIFGTSDISEVLPKSLSKKVNYILALNENVALSMADGFCRGSERPGFAILNSPQGIINSLGSLYNVYRDGSVVVILSTPKEIIPGTDVPIQFVKGRWSIQRTDKISRVIIRAFQVATIPPEGPVFLNFPVDLQLETTEFELAELKRHRISFRPDAEDVIKASDLLLKSKFPLMIAGNDIARRDALPEAVELVDMLALPVISEDILSLTSTNFPQDHPFYLGPFYPKDEVLAKVDLIFAVGCRIETSYPEGFPFPSGLKIIHLYPDSMELGKNYPVDLPIFADAKMGLRDMGSYLRQYLPGDKGRSIEERRRKVMALKEKREKRKEEEIKKSWNQTPMAFTRLVMEIGKILDEDVVVISDDRAMGFLLVKYLPFAEKGSYFFSSGGWPGWSLGASLGIKLAIPGKKIIALLRDRSFIAGIQALWTAVKHQIPITAVVCNPRSSIEMDILALTRGFGIEAKEVAEADEFRPVLEKSLRGNRPIVIDVLVEDLW